jgi:hypothetical protein
MNDKDIRKLAKIKTPKVKTFIHDNYYRNVILNYDTELMSLGTNIRNNTRRIVNQNITLSPNNVAKLLQKIKLKNSELALKLKKFL